jgi:hypothetical protein
MENVIKSIIFSLIGHFLVRGKTKSKLLVKYGKNFVGVEEQNLTLTVLC